MGRGRSLRWIAAVALLSLILPAARADVPGVTLTLSGPATFLPGQTVTYSGRLLAAGAVGIPLQTIQLFRSGSRAATATTGPDGAWSAAVVLPYPPETHVLVAVAYDDTPLETSSQSVIAKVQRRTLTVLRTGTGSGTVTGQAGILCPGSSCTASVPHGSAVSLTATPDDGSVFSGWTGCSGTGPTCSVVMDADKTVSAAFTLMTTMRFAFPTSSQAESTSVSISVVRSGDTSVSSSVSWTTQGGTAHSPSDYTGGSGTLTFAPGQSSATIVIATVADSLDEPDETFTVTLSAPFGGVLGSITAHTHTIIDNDFPPVVAFPSSSSGGLESSSAQISVALSAASGRTITVQYQTGNGTASAPGDYTAVSGTLTFVPGDTLETITVPIIDDDVIEANETFTISLSGAVNATPGGTTHTRTILDNDSAVSNNETGTPQEADYVVLQFPSTISVSSGETTPLIFGRVFENDVAQTAESGADPQVVAQVGYGPAGSDPRSAAGWTWVGAVFNLQAGNDDEYMGQLTAPAAGTYAYTYRFSFDGGASFTYADLDGAGSNSGQDFSASTLGQMTVA